MIHANVKRQSKLLERWSFHPVILMIYRLSNLSITNDGTYPEISNQHEILWPILCKKWGFSWNLTFFLFLLWISFTWNWQKNVYIFSKFFGIKSETGWWFHVRNWHKIMKPPDSVGKKNWNWRHAASPRPSVSIFFPTEFWRFHNFSQFHPWNHSQFHFWAKKTENKTASFIQFHVKLATHKKKNMRFLPKTIRGFTKILVKIKNTKVGWWKNCATRPKFLSMNTIKSQ